MSPTRTSHGQCIRRPQVQYPAMWGISALLSGKSSGSIHQYAQDCLEQRSSFGVSEPSGDEEFVELAEEPVVSVPEGAGAVAFVRLAGRLEGRTGLLGAVDAEHEPVLVNQLGAEQNGSHPGQFDQFLHL